MQSPIKSNEDRWHYLQRARRYARRRFNAIREEEGYHAHASHAAAQALVETEERFIDLGTFGVEGFCCDRDDFSSSAKGVSYLNTGDTYGLTVLAVASRYNASFRVGCWGDIAERCPNA